MLWGCRIWWMVCLVYRILDGKMGKWKEKFHIHCLARMKIRKLLFCHNFDTCSFFLNQPLQQLCFNVLTQAFTSSTSLINSLPFKFYLCCQSSAIILTISYFSHTSQNFIKSQTFNFLPSTPEVSFQISQSIVWGGWVISRSLELTYMLDFSNHSQSWQCNSHDNINS